MTTIPTSGAFLRAFARARMTAGARHVATTIASAISYDGRYRGAPRGHAAFTMIELQEITGLAARTIQVALTELAEMFGLVVVRRHHQRHFFRFTKITAGADTIETGAGADTTPDSKPCATRSQMRVAPYIEEQRNNNCSVKVEIREDESVWRTPWASVIERFKRGTPAENMDTQYLWSGFCGLNRRNGREQVPLRFLIGFLKKYPKKPATWTKTKPAAPPPQPKPAAIDPAIRSLVELASPAPYENRYFHKADLQRHIGAGPYEDRVRAMMTRFACARFQAELSVHGEAVRHGEITR